MYIETIAGLLLLLASAEVMLRGAVDVSVKGGLPKAFIAFSIIGFGTSAPELMVSTLAAANDKPGLALGNVVGSNTMNILLVLGLSGLFARLPMRSASSWRMDMQLLSISVLLTALLLTVFSEIGRVAGLLMVLGYTGYLVWAYRHNKASVADTDEVAASRWPLWASLAALFGGLAGVIWGADLLVHGATGLARSFGISETVIGLTLVAFGTSLPELVTSVMACLRGHQEMAIANVLGSNIMNTFVILGAAATISPIPALDMIMTRDLWVMAGASAVLIGAAMVREILPRWLAGAMLLSYGVYVWAVFS